MVKVTVETAGRVEAANVMRVFVFPAKKQMQKCQMYIIDYD
jgi:hypothetical protein